VLRTSTTVVSDRSHSKLGIVTGERAGHGLGEMPPPPLPSAGLSYIQDRDYARPFLISLSLFQYPGIAFSHPPTLNLDSPF